MKDMEIKNMDDMKSVTKIQKQIWSIFEVFHAEAFGFHDLDLILLLLSLYKDDQITENFLLHQNKIELTQLVSDRTFHYQKAQRDYQPIIDVFSNSLRQMSEVGFHKVIDLLFEIDKMTLKENFRGVFETTLYHIVSSQGKMSMPIQPIELTRFIYSLVKLPENSKVFNPFAGLASFGVYQDKNQAYFGQEVNQRNWALGVLRLMAHGKLKSSSYVCDDSVLNWTDHSEKFDLIVSHPPFSHRINDRSLFKELGLNVRTIEQFLINKGIDSLNEKGKLIAILPEGFLFKGGIEKQIREDLVKQDLIDTIVSLPGGLLPNTSIPLVIIVINKSKNTPEKVRFVDAENFVESIGSTKKVLDDNKLSELIKRGYQHSDSIRIVDNDQIKASDYNLNVPRYFMKNDISGIKLDNFLELVKGHREDLPTLGKFVGIRDLKDDNLDFNLDALNVEENEFGQQSVRLINESCLLLATVWKSLKPTYFEYTDTPIYINNDILAFKIDEKVVDIAYLINELHAHYVEKQLAAYREGATISKIRRNDLLDVIIKLPSLKEQRAKMQGILEVSDKIKEYKKQRDDLVHDIDNKTYERFATVKHSLGTPLLSIGSSLRNMENALFKIDKDWDTVKVSERFNVTLRDTIDSMKSNIDLIHSILKNNESFLDVSKYPLSEFEFIEFVKNLFKKITSSQNSNVKTNLDIHTDIQREFKNKAIINGSKELLEIALNNIVENASKHGFTDKDRSYKLEINVSLVFEKHTHFEGLVERENYLKLEVSNNGNPFPENYTIEKLTRLGSSAGNTRNTGQGGYELNEIIKRHNHGKSTLDLITNGISSEFTTTYIFLLPLKN